MAIRTGGASQPKVCLVSQHPLVLEELQRWWWTAAVNMTMSPGD
ncbi:MAG: hypothetical protein ACRD1X_07775 [Vicinamibacteria bacterium]